MSGTMVNIGKIVGAAGLKGEVKIFSYSGQLQRYNEVKFLYLGKKEEVFEIENVRFMKNTPIVKFFAVNDRNAAEKLRGFEVYIDEDDLSELPEGEFYVRDLLGMSVVNCDGTRIGELIRVIQDTPQDVYEVMIENGKSIFIPFVEAFVKDIDLDSRKIRVELIDGMMENQA